MRHQPQQNEVGEDLAREHRFQVEFEVGLPRECLVVAKNPESQPIGDDCPQMPWATIQELLNQPVRVGRRRATHSRGATIEAQAATDQVHGRRTEESIDGVGATIDLRSRAGWQQTEPEFAQQRHTPLIIGQTGSRFVFGQIAGCRAELGPMAAHAIPGLGDRLVDPFAGWKAIIFGPGAGEIALGIDGAAQQVSRQQTALGMDRLEFVSCARH